MIGSIGIPELVIVCALALLVFGPTKLPGLGKSLGEAIRGFKKAITDNGEAPVENSERPPPSTGSAKV